MSYGTVTCMTIFIINFHCLIINNFNGTNIRQFLDVSSDFNLFFSVFRDWMSPSDLTGNYPHMVVMGTGLAFGFLVVIL